MNREVPYVPGRLVPYVSLDKETEAKITARMGRFASEQHMLGWWEGWQETVTQSILRILNHRGVAVDVHSRDRIVDCMDIDTLEAWLDRSLMITEIPELFQD